MKILTKKQIWAFTATLVAGFGANSSAAMTPSKASALDQNAALTEAMLHLNDATKKIQILQANLDSIQGFQSSLLSTVYWSLGVIAGVAAALIAYSWVVNFKLLEREKENIRKDLLASIEENTSESLREINKNIDSSIGSKLSSSLFELNNLKIDFQIHQAKAQNHPSGRILHYSYVLETLFKVEYRDHLIPDMLGEILSEIQKSDDGITSTAFNRLNETLEHTPKKYSGYKLRIDEKLRETRIF